MKDFLYAYSDAIDESFEKGTEQGQRKSIGTAKKFSALTPNFTNIGAVRVTALSSYHKALIWMVSF